MTLFLLVACGPMDAQESFELTVVPVLEASCASTTCHGVAPDAEASGQVIQWDTLVFEVDQGRIVDTELAREAARRAINTVEDPAFSSLLRKPLSVDQGGLPHYGHANFTGPEDPAYQAILEWIEREERGGEDPEPLNELEQQFSDGVQPALVEGTCMSSGCHGLQAGGIPYVLDVGYGGAFSIDAIRHNYEESLEQLSLHGFPDQSRLLRKAQAMDRGIAHKGTNFDFFTDAGEEAVKAWICAEREARTGQGCAEGLPLEALVFVGGPLEPEHPFELEGYTPGTDLYLATVGDEGVTSIENLTGELHEQPADVRDPAVSPDGSELLFSMREEGDEGHSLYWMDLATGQVTRLTDAPGSDRDPTWGADQTIWFVSTRRGLLDHAGRRADSDLYSLELGTDAPRRWTSTPHAERKPSWYDIGPNGGEISVSALREVVSGQARAHPFRFPPNLSTEYHQHFGVSPGPDLFYDMRETADGRYVAIVGDLANAWPAGQLGVVDRNLGPELRDGDEPSFELYLPPLTLLDETSSPSGETGTAWRDPAPLADGRLLVAASAEPLDLGDDEANPRFRIELVSLTEATDGSGPQMTERQVLVDLAGLSAFDPEPIWHHAPHRVEGEHQPKGDTGLFLHHGLPLVDALLGALPPTGARLPSHDIVGVRLVEALPTTWLDRTPLAPEETRHGHVDATSAGLVRHPPARILAEMPLADDGSFTARVPADVPFRLQALDADGMAIGAMHNRWYEVAAGQVVIQGLTVQYGEERYGSLCASCHGNLDGSDSSPELAQPDLMTGASLTLSRYENQDPRRPIEPEPVGEETLEVDFERDLQPLLVERCSGCHGPPTPAAGLSLTDTPTLWFSDAYESLLAPGERSGGGFDYVDGDAGMANNSLLVEVLRGEELEAPGTFSGPAHQEHLTDEELMLVIRWIDLGATWEGTR